MRAAAPHRPRRHRGHRILHTGQPKGRAREVVRQKHHVGVQVLHLTARLRLRRALHCLANLSVKRDPKPGTRAALPRLAPHHAPHLSDRPRNARGLRGVQGLLHDLHVAPLDSEASGRDATGNTDEAHQCVKLPQALAPVVGPHAPLDELRHERPGHARGEPCLGALLGEVEAPAAAAAGERPQHILGVPEGGSFVKQGVQLLKVGETFP
mmetsp:Transcript_2007/g.5448  ORF Transcript_2007/g.5448 Transcript_2007/m.5448 type:complete len:210 (-) Transcript_2007:587-1216(-)